MFIDRYLKPNWKKWDLAAAMLRREGVRVVLPADEVSGVQRFHPKELKDVPSTVSKAATAHSRAVIAWSGHLVGLLDEQLLFRTLQGSVG